MSEVTDQNIGNNDGGQGQAGAGNLGWRTELPEAQRGHEAFASYNSKSELYKGVIDLHTANKEATQKLTDLEGRIANSIPRLTENATPEQKQAYRQAIGVPDNAEGYEIPVPEGSTPELANAFKAFAFAEGIPKDIAKKAGEWFNGVVAKIEESINATRQAEHDTNLEALKKEWGADYDKNAEYVKKAYAQFKEVKGFDDLLNLQIGGTADKPVTLGNHPLMSVVFKEIGKAIASDVSLPGAHSIGTPPNMPGVFNYPDMKT